MAREIFIVKNVSTNDIELKDFGLVIPSSIEIELGDFDDAYLSEDLDTFLSSGDLVRVIDGSTVSYNDAYLFTVTSLIKPVSFADFYNASSQALSLTAGTYTDIQWDGTRIYETSDYELLTGNTEIQFKTDGKFLVVMRVTVNQISGNGRSDEVHRLEIDTGGGYNIIPGTTGYIYSRSTAQGRGGDTVAVVVDVSSGHKIKGSGALNSGTAGLEWPVNGCSITISNMKGQPGHDGRDGTDGVDGSIGPQGPPGSGSTIGIYDHGTFDDQYWNINFTGSGVTVSAGTDPSTVDVDISGGSSSIDVSIGVKDEGTLVGRYENLDFTGNIVTASEQDSQNAEVAINQIHGSEWQYAQDLTETSTTATTPQVKVTLNTTNLPEGKYKINATWVGRHSSASNDMEFDVTLDGTPLGTNSTMNIETKDTTNYVPYSRFYVVDLTSGTHSVEIRYWCESSTTYISDAIIELYRVQ